MSLKRKKDAGQARGEISQVGAFSVAGNLGNYENLYMDIALVLNKAGYAEFVANNFTSFVDDSHSSIVNDLINRGQGELVLLNLKEIKNTSHSEIILSLIREGKGRDLARNARAFEQEYHVFIVDELIKAGMGHIVAYNYDQFLGLESNDGAIAQLIIDSGQGNAVADNIELFGEIYHTGIADSLRKAGLWDAVERNFEDFYGISLNEVAPISNMPASTISAVGR